MKKSYLINFGLTLCLFLSTILASCCINLGDVLKAKYDRTENLSVPIKDQTELYVETDVGSITITGVDVTDCNITAEIAVKARTKEKARELAEQVKIVLEPSGDKLTIRAKTPDALKKSSLAVDFKIAAPMRLSVNCMSHVGTIEVSDIEGSIKASADVGSIVCRQVVADMDLESNVGSVEVKYADAAPSACNAEITTNVGSIKFTGPAQISAQLDASTNVGSIKTDKPITVVGKLGKSIKGTIGAGQGKLSLKTNVGSIEIE